MGALFSSPPTLPAPPLPPPLPPPAIPATMADASVRAAGINQRQRAQASAGAGMGGTIKTGPGGAAAPPVATPMLQPA